MMDRREKEESCGPAEDRGIPALTIHERFCCDGGFAIARAFGGQARRSLPRRTVQVRLGASRFRMLVSQRDCAISRRTIMNNAG